MTATNCIDADTAIYSACFATEKTIYDLVLSTCPLVVAAKEGNLDMPEYEMYKDHIIQTFEYAKDVKEYIKKVDKGDAFFTRLSRKRVEPLAHALHLLNRLIKETVDAVGADTSILFLTDGKGTFRDKIATLREYKGNRKDKAKPLYYHQARQHLIDRWGAIVTDNIEADDAVAILQTQIRNTGNFSCISTVDKDLNQVPGWHYNYDKKTFKFVTPEEGIKFFYNQMLQGDGTDYVPGVDGIGPKKAAAILDPLILEADMARATLTEYRNAYCKEGGKFADATARKIMTEMGQLLWMQREPGQLWEIPV